MQDPGRAVAGDQRGGVDLFLDPAVCGPAARARTSTRAACAIGADQSGAVVAAPDQS